MLLAAAGAAGSVLLTTYGESNAETNTGKQTEKNLSPQCRRIIWALALNYSLLTCYGCRFG